jgi:hypothetical protein
MTQNTKSTLVSLVLTTFVFLSLFLGLPAPARAQFSVVNSAVVNYGNNTITVSNWTTRPHRVSRSNRTARFTGFRERRDSRARLDPQDSPARQVLKVTSVPQGRSDLRGPSD